ncbi:MAG: nicotinate-nucleotide pyrophosphorylase [carboxylating] [Rhodothalassiaceae bacterium]|nr:MAG: nicotinate-nucleotide pyrophosphorylase [carboxylating] [Rhodothalassiaceae bacterium]
MARAAATAAEVSAVLPEDLGVFGARADFPLARGALAALVAEALAEDLGPGDVTSAAVVPEDARMRVVMRAREPLVLAGLPLAAACFAARDAHAAITAHAGDGAELRAGGVALEVEARARAVLEAERTALNFVCHLSGVATLARRFVDAVAGTRARILDTRKTLPLYRALQKYATRCGGAMNHRMGLHDAMLIKDNHIAVAGGLEAAVEAARRAGHRDIEVECDTLEQVRAALALGVSRILLDNMTTDELRQAVALAGGRAVLEASGGVRLETVRAIAETGVDFISIGRLTMSAPAVDLGLDALAAD